MITFDSKLFIAVVTTTGQSVGPLLTDVITLWLSSLVCFTESATPMIIQSVFPLEAQCLLQLTMRALFNSFENAVIENWIWFHILTLLWVVFCAYVEDWRLQLQNFRQSFYFWRERRKARIAVGGGGHRLKSFDQTSNAHFWQHRRGVKQESAGPAARPLSSSAHRATAMLLNAFEAQLLD